MVAFRDEVRVSRLIEENASWHRESELRNGTGEVLAGLSDGLLHDDACANAYFDKGLEGSLRRNARHI